VIINLDGEGEDGAKSTARKEGELQAKISGLIWSKSPQIIRGRTSSASSRQRGRGRKAENSVSAGQECRGKGGKTSSRKERTDRTGESGLEFEQFGEESVHNKETRDEREYSRKGGGTGKTYLGAGVRG